ncbi:carboxymuconolactone decarboxylase family protein [Sporolactobacillus inulinus]|nr:carboxymuconolactone decarboxylase family protein [Sporolactobacillus inulinus]RYL94262.1 carboxymuconolactone decarboxylase family protein [Sporolactobacillus sp. THM7-4]
MMNIHDLLEQMKKQSGSTPLPMKLLSQLDESAVFEHVNNKKWLYSKTAVPNKYKLLMSIAAAAALGQETCIISYVKSALIQGISKDEIVEALLTARFVKGTTVISASLEAMKLLVNQTEKLT